MRIRPCHASLHTQPLCSTSLRQLLPGCQREEQLIAATKARLRRLHAKQVNHITGRQAFFADMLLKSRSVNAAHVSGGFSKLDVMRLHAAHYEKLAASKKQQYEVKATHMRADKAAAITEDIEAQRARLEQLQTDRLAEAEPGSMMLGQCQLSASTLSALEDLYASDLYPQKTVKELRKQVGNCPPPLSQERMAKLKASSLLAPQREEQYGVLARKVAQNRRVLQHSVLVVCAADTWTFYRFVLAVLQLKRAFSNPPFCAPTLCHSPSKRGYN